MTDAETLLSTALYLVGACLMVGALATLLGPPGIALGLGYLLTQLLLRP